MTSATDLRKVQNISKTFYVSSFWLTFNTKLRINLTRQVFGTAGRISVQLQIHTLCIPEEESSTLQQNRNVILFLLVPVTRAFSSSYTNSQSALTSPPINCRHD